ncbi:MAG: acetylglutamate kinase [Opitutaceae bacterium]|nr:acetylglutamate kinase [Opitutaceae bacterium]|tara:strand:+ start:2675 stop:3574 length:900 start_codon:yes stop_codon:yes gene_type:complete
MEIVTSPSEKEVIAKAQVLLEALPYIQQFEGSIFVVKYGGSFMDDPDPEIRMRFASDIVFLASVGIHVVVVHGGGKAISLAMENAGIKPRFINGMRYTDESNVSIVEETLNKTVNLDICELVQARNGKPLGMAGQTVFTCTKLTKDPAGNPLDLGNVGEIQIVNSRLIKRAISQGYTPIISPIGSDEDGNLYNINADVAAAYVACVLHARRLVYMTDVPGLLRNPDDNTSIISTLSANEVPALKEEGVIGKGMLPKVDSAIKAMREGVHRVHFVHGRLPHSILLEIFTDKGVGTEIVHS